METVCNSTTSFFFSTDTSVPQTQLFMACRLPLKHIFEKQVYGLAPTEIIYKIATSYILGFDEDTKNIKHNFRQLDALPYAKDGTLEQMLDELDSEDE